MKFNDITMIHAKPPVGLIEFQTALYMSASDGGMKCQGSALRGTTLMGCRCCCYREIVWKIFDYTTYFVNYNSSVCYTSYFHLCHTKLGNVFSPNVHLIHFLVTLYNDMLVGRTDSFVVEKE
jgi:hypothetical protein